MPPFACLLLLACFHVPQVGTETVDYKNSHVVVDALSQNALFTFGPVALLDPSLASRRRDVQ